MIQHLTIQKLRALFVTRALPLVLPLSMVAAQLGACGDGSSIFDSPDEGAVVDVRVDPEAIRIGELATVEVRFDSATFIDSDGDEFAAATEVVVLLPPGMDFVSASSRLDGSVLEGFNDRPANTVEICPDGSRAIRYEFAAGELSDIGENTVRLQGKAFESRGLVSVGAVARSSLGAPCGVTLQDSEAVTLTR